MSAGAILSLSNSRAFRQATRCGEETTRFLRLWTPSNAAGGDKGTFLFDIIANLDFHSGMKPFRGENNGHEATLYSRLAVRDGDKLITVANLR